MSNPMMTLSHCSAFAARRALATGNVIHVIATGEPAMPLAIIDEATLFANADYLSFEDLRFTADPAELVQSRERARTDAPPRSAADPGEAQRATRILTIMLPSE